MRIALRQEGQPRVGRDRSYPLPLNTTDLPRAIPAFPGPHRVDPGRTQPAVEVVVPPVQAKLNEASTDWGTVWVEVPVAHPTSEVPIATTDHVAPWWAKP